MRRGTHYKVTILGATLAALTACAAMVLAGPGYTTRLDVQYIDDGAEAHRVDCRVPEGGGPVPAIISLHAGGWSSGDKRADARIGTTLARLGYATYAANYTLGTPDRPSWSAAQADVAAIVRWVKSQPRVNPKRVYLLGSSAGGHLALLHAYRVRDVKGVIAISAPSNLVSLATTGGGVAYVRAIAGRDWELKAEALSPVNYIDEGAPVSCIIHGCKDSTVDIAQADALADKLIKTGIPTEYHRTMRGNHVCTYMYTCAETYEAIIDAFCTASKH